MTVSIDEIMENIRAEDDEKAFIQNFILPDATSYINNYINRSYSDLNDDEKKVYDRAILFTVSDWYLHRGAGGRNPSTTKYTGLNAIIDSIRIPGVGIYDDSEDSIDG